MKTTLETQKEKAVQAMRNYLNALNNTSYNGRLVEHVYCLFCEGGIWEDNLYDYQMICVDLLKAMGGKQVQEVLSKELGEYTYKLLPGFLHSFFYFAKVMDSKNFKALLYMYEVDSMKEYSIDQLRAIESEYEHKLELLGYEKGRKLVEMIKESERTKDLT